jgi:hypothetical protein
MKGILLDENYELVIDSVLDGGLIVQGVVVGEIDYQRVKTIIESQKGEIKEYPTLGLGIDNYLKSVKRRQQFINELAKELKTDGLNPKIIVGEDLSQFEIEL